MIYFSCGRCGKRYSTPEQNTGNTGRCKQCGTPMTVPIIVNSSGATPPPIRQEIEEFETEPPPSTVARISYQIVNCPHCLRGIRLTGDMMTMLVQCSKCDTTFDPRTGDIVATEPQQISVLPPGFGYQSSNDTYVPPERGVGFGVASLVLGVVSIPLAMFICLYSGVPGLVCAVLAIVFGAISLTARSGPGMGVAGMVLGIVTIAIWCLTFFSVLNFARKIEENLKKPATNRADFKMQDPAVRD